MERLKLDKPTIVKQKVHTKKGSKKKRMLYIFIVNNLLLLTGLAMVISGLALQVGYHIGRVADHHGINPQGIESGEAFWFLNYQEWSLAHKYAFVFFTLFMVFHIYDHWMWYNKVISTRKMGNKRLVIILSVLFVLVAITGFAPWLVGIVGGASSLEFILIEVHDKLALIMVIHLLIHVIKRLKWFPAGFRSVVKKY